MEKFPIEIFDTIFKHLKVNEILNCRLVCKKWNFLIENSENCLIELNLHINLEPTSFKWHHQPNIIYKNSLRINSLDCFGNEKFQFLFRKLKRLYIEVYMINSIFIQHLNKFKYLEHLQIQTFYGELKGDLNLNRLKTIHFSDNVIEDLNLHCPNLIAVSNLFFIKKLRFFESKKSLEVIEGNNLINLEYPMPNLKKLCCDKLEYGFEIDDFPNLKELHINRCEDYALNSLLAQKQSSKKDLKIFYKGFLIDNNNSRNVYNLLDKNYLEFAKSNYDNISDKLLYLTEMVYTRNLGILFNEMENNFYEKLINLKTFFILEKFNDKISFMKTCRNLFFVRILNVCCELDQDFFDNLPNILPKLIILSSNNFPQLNVENVNFVSKLNNLLYCSFPYKHGKLTIDKRSA